MAKKHEEPEKNEKEPAAPEAAKQAEAPKQPEGSKQKAESKQPDALEQAKAAQAQEHDQFLRLAAEYDNFRKRTQREKDGIYQDAVADTVKKTSAQAIREMQKMGLSVVMLTGDHEKTEKAIQ